jgi:hypothetical protein
MHAGLLGIVLGLISGFKFPKIGNWGGCEVKPLCKVIKIPPLIGMIIMGCVVRNTFGDVVKPYPNVWAQWIRSCCLAVLLVRGGL